MLNPFKAVPIYVKVYVDKIEMTRLDNHETISKEAKKDKFSNQRLVLANFYNAELVARQMLKELFNVSGLFQRPMSMLLQQMEKCEGGLSMVEKRVLYDLGQRCGAGTVAIVDHNNPMTDEEILKILSDAI